MKVLKAILGIILVLVILGGVFFLIDKGRFNKNEKPIFAVRMQEKDGGKVTYMGLGYKIVTYPGVSPKETFKTTKYKKMLCWFQDYEKPKMVEVKEKAQDIKEAVINSTEDFYKYLEDKKIKVEKEIEKFDEKEARDKNYYLFKGKEEINREKLDEFMDKYGKNENAFLKVATSTKEGDFILYHIVYEKMNKKIYMVVDTTRDKHADEKTRRIELYKLDNIEIKEENSKKKLVAYEGKEYRPELSSVRSAEITEVK